MTRSPSNLFLFGFLWLVMLFVVFSAETKANDADSWESATLVEHPSLRLRFLYRTSANMADSDWAALEFENLTNEPVQIRSLLFTSSINVTKPHPAQSYSTSLWSMQAKDLCGASTIYLDPHASRRLGTTQLCNDAICRLRCPAEEAWKVCADVSAWFTLQSKSQEVEIRDKGSFAFRWTRLDTSEVSVLQDRLRGMLDNPPGTQGSSDHHALLDAYLSVPAIAAATSCEDLLDAIAARQGVWSGRRTIAKHLGLAYKDDPQVVRFFAKLLDEHQHEGLEDLYASTIWDKTFVDRLVSWYECDWDQVGFPNESMILGILQRHIDDWITDGATARRLSRAFLHHFPQFSILCPADLRERGSATDAATPPDEDERRFDAWCSSLSRLALSRDEALIPELEDQLQDRRMLGVLRKNYGVIPQDPPAPLRPCDGAALTILRILDGPTGPTRSFWKVLSSEGLHLGLSAARESMQVRDRMIRDLIVRLDQRRQSRQ